MTGRWRSVVAGILGVLAVIGVLASAVAVWARGTLFDSDRVAAVVGDALVEPEVDQALAQHVATQVFAAVDVDEVVADVLPASLSRLEPAIVGGIEGAVERGLTAAFGDERVQELLTDAVRRAHSAAMQLLQGDGLVDGVEVNDGEVTLNLLPLVGRGLTLVQDLGLLSGVELPDLTRAGDPTAQVAELETALGRDLPDDFGQLVVYRSDSVADAQASLESAQQALAFAKRALWVLLGVTVVLLALTVIVARNRWRAALLLGLGGIVAMVLARTAIHRVVDEAPDLVAQPGAKAAVTSIVGDVGTSLLRVMGVLLLIAAVVVALAVFRRHLQRADLVAVIAVLTGVAVIALVGLTIGSLIAGIVLAILAAIALGRWWPQPESGTTAAA
jgi:hypothetical protein